MFENSRKLSIEKLGDYLYSVFFLLTLWMLTLFEGWARGCVSVPTTRFARCGAKNLKCLRHSTPDNTPHTTTNAAASINRYYPRRMSKPIITYQPYSYFDTSRLTHPILDDKRDCLHQSVLSKKNVEDIPHYLAP